MATAKLKRKFTENPDSQKSSPIKLLILKKCGFALNDPKTKKNKNKNTRKDWSLFLS